MIKASQSQQQLPTVARLVQLLMQMRIDVKKESPDTFRSLMERIRRRSQPEPPPKSSSLSQVEVKEIYGVRSKMGKGKNAQVDNITVLFSFIDKKDQTVGLVEVWMFSCQRQPSVPNNNTMQSESSKTEMETELLLEDFLQNIFKLPLWVDYWGNIDNRKALKQNYILNYQIVYGDYTSHEGFWYNCKIEKQKRLVGMTLRLGIYYQTKVKAFQQLAQAKKQLDKTILCNKMSSDNQNTRKRSVYQYYDNDLDVTFVSSEGEFNLGQNSMSEIKFQIPCEQQSDQEYELIVESIEEIKARHFRDELKKLKPKTDALEGPIPML